MDSQMMEVSNRDQLVVIAPAGTKIISSPATAFRSLCPAMRKVSRRKEPREVWDGAEREPWVHGPPV